MTVATDGDVELPRGTAYDEPNAQAHARAREDASLAVTEGGQRLVDAVRRDLADGWAQTQNSWIVRQAPPSLRQVVRDAKPSNAAIDHPILMAGHTVWAFGIAVPVTAALYTLAWLLQHPARGLTAALITALIVVIWVSS